MFALVALLALYAGTNNIRKAFNLAARTGWSGMPVIMIFLGIILILVGLRCVWQAMKDLEAKNKETEERQLEEQQKNQQQFFYDEENNDVPPADSSDISE